MPSSRFQLFSRNVPPPFQSLAEAAHALAKDPDILRRAVGLNLIYDHRVSDQRATHFLTYLQGKLGSTSLTADDLFNQIREYRKVLVATRPTETFDQYPASECNFVRKEREMAHVCNVSRKVAHISRSSAIYPGVGRAMGALGMGKRAYAEEEVNITLESRVKRPGRVPELVRALLHLFAEYQKDSPWHPVWVACWKQFESSTLADRPSSWLEAVGIPSEPNPSWLMLLRYPSSICLRVYRPTQFEAGIFHYHFPSSPYTELDDGGCAMQLFDASSYNDILLSEFVHPEVSFNLSHWEAAGSQFQRADKGSYESLMSYRGRHHALMCLKQGSERVLDWMPSATVLDE